VGEWGRRVGSGPGGQEGESGGPNGECASIWGTRKGRQCLLTLSGKQPGQLFGKQRHRMWFGSATVVGGG
jgi:hypothetical protein